MRTNSLLSVILAKAGIHLRVAKRVDPRLREGDGIRMHSSVSILIAALLACFGAVSLADVPNALRGATPLDQESKSPAIARVENTDIKRKRAYTDQPPTIPHKIDGYEISLNVNKCMMCHSRERTEEFQAPMVSATHFMDRDYDYLAQISPRRYFCTQCHVPQTDARVPVRNNFEDVDDIIARLRAEQAKKK